MNNIKIKNLCNEESKEAYAAKDTFQKCVLLFKDAPPNVNSSLKELQSILKEQPTLTKEYFVPLFHSKKSKFLHVLRSFEESDAQITCMQCLDIALGCLPVQEITIEQLEVCEEVLDILLCLHYQPNPLRDDAQLSLFLCSSLTLLNKIIVYCPTYAQTHLAELFGIIHAYVTCSQEPGDARNLPNKISASQQMVCDYNQQTEACNFNASNRSARVSKLRKPRVATKIVNEAATALCSFDIGKPTYIGGLSIDLMMSDSEPSENENLDISIKKHYKYWSKLSFLAISLLANIAHTQESRVLYGYWHAIFPSRSGESHNNLLNLALRAPSTRCRLAALQVAGKILFDAKRFVRLAETSSGNPPLAFLPFAHSLAFMILAIYDVLAAVLVAEKSLLVRTQALKCIAVLVEATPFRQLDDDIVNKFMPTVRQLLQHSDSTMQVAALSVFENLLATPDMTAAIAAGVGLPAPCKGLLNATHRNNDADHLIEIEDFGSNEYIFHAEAEITATVNCDTPDEPISWLMQLSLQNLFENTIPIKMKSLQVLSLFASNYCLSTHIEQVAKALKSALHDAQLDVRLCASRCLESWSYQIAHRLVDDDVKTCEQLECGKTFWSILLPVTMQTCTNLHEKAVLKVSLCSAISNMGVVIFERLPYDEQTKLLSFLTGVGSSDPEAVTQAAAVRSLAVFALFPSLRKNYVFIENLAELIMRLIVNANMAVRIKVVWALSNVSDILVCNRRSLCEESISNDLLRRLLVSAISSCNDCDKVRCSGVRTIGNLLSMLDDWHFEDAIYRNIFLNAVAKLKESIRSSGSAKVKWNACYAVGNFLRNNAIFAATTKFTDFEWQSSIFSTLCNAIAQHANFKVRISATFAISQITSRSCFGSYFEMMWCTLLQSIEQSHNLENFYEYNHRDQLQEQLCLAICHHIRLATVSDYIMLKAHLQDRIDIVRTTWIRVSNRLVPEKSASLMLCSFVMEELLASDSQIPIIQREAIEYCVKAFNLQKQILC